MEPTSTREQVVRLVLAAVREPGASFPGGADDAEIADLREAVGVPLPPELEEWLQVCKGDVIGPGGLYGVRQPGGATSIASMLELFPGWRERGWLPVAGDGNGDYYVLLTAGELAGQVGFVDQCDYDVLDHVVAGDLWTLVRNLLLADAGRA